MEYLTWSTFSTIVYFSLYLVLMICLSICIGTHQYNNAKGFCHHVWSRKAIYGQILAHLYDIATDIGVLIEWYLLATDGTDYDHIDMNIMFWASISCHIFYRIISALFAFYSKGDMDYDYSYFTIKYYLRDFCLGICDMYVFMLIYKTFKHRHKEITAQQKVVQLIESICESLPQVVLQSVFIIRSYNDEKLRSNSSIELVIASLLASIFSVANKYTWLDRGGMKEDAKNSGCNTSCPCFNLWYALRVIWRFSFVSTRFCALCLLWSVLGGAFLGLFIGLSFFMWFILFMVLEHTPAGKMRKFGDGLLFAIASVIATPVNDEIIYTLAHVIEMLITWTIITIFATVPSIDCIICADPESRQASNNPYIWLFVFLGWNALIIEYIGIAILIICAKFEDDALNESFYLFLAGTKRISEASDATSSMCQLNRTALPNGRAGVCLDIIACGCLD